MATGAMLWGAAYNNGILPFKNYILGEAYTREGEGSAIAGPPLQDAAAARRTTVCSLSLQRCRLGDGKARGYFSGIRTWRAQHSEYLPGDRASQFPRPYSALRPGRPDIRQSNRGSGTGQRISVPLINITKPV